MNLQQLYYFRKLAEVQHYTEAAKALYITQPSLSDSIASLEHELSVSLFQKKGRGVQLTKYGQEFYEYVNQALGILEHGIAAVREKSDSVTGHWLYSDASWRFSPECPRSLPRKMSAGKLQYLP